MLPFALPRENRIHINPNKDFCIGDTVEIQEDDPDGKYNAGQKGKIIDGERLSGNVTVKIDGKKVRCLWKHIDGYDY